MSNFDRNYGAIATAREHFQGNNGYVTVGLNLPSTVAFPGTTAYNTAKAAVDAAAFASVGDATAQAQIAANQLLISTAQRNLFRVAQAIGQRAVVIAVSDVQLDTSSNLDAVSLALNSNVLAGVKAGTTSTTGTVSVPNIYFTFLIERADVLTAQAAKPGTNSIVLSVNPAQDIVNQFVGTFFEPSTYQASPSGDSVTAKVAATGAILKVFDSLPVAK